MNKSNLVPQNKRAKNVQREIARLGGLAKAAKERERKRMREWLELLAEFEITDEVTGEKLPCEEIICLRLMDKAIKGDLKAIRLYAELKGELDPQRPPTQIVPIQIINDGLD